MTDDTVHFDLPRLLESLRDVRVAVFGDFCVDAYWHLDVGAEPLSVETGLPVWCVRSQQYSLGGAGNVAANLIDLGVRSVHAVGLIGRDLFGWQLRRLLQERGADITHMLDADPGWQTPAYVKPYKADVEKNRLDFGGFNNLSEKTGQALCAALDRVAGSVDAVVVNQQLEGGVGVGVPLVERINTIIAAHPRTTFVVDSRDHAGRFRNAVLKMNTAEAGRILHPSSPEEEVSASRACEYARQLSGRTSRPVFLTRGENGIVVADGLEVHQVPGIQILEQTDTVGAGDAVVAALAAALGARCSPLAAAPLANIAASITVRKLRTTGTATPAEILKVGPNPDYVYAPELAADPRQARFIENTHIEIVEPLPSRLRIQHALFDHDGTLSVLREGWELVMEPMMVRAVLGPHFTTAEPALYAKVSGTVRQFIDKTTGIQTLVQMQGLVELVRQFDCVPREQILDEHGYKRVYNDELMKIVRDRIRRLRKGELDSADFQIKNAGRLLQALHDRGVRLYLASGTDEADVVAEAEAMGYAHLFQGRIFGAVGDVNIEAKKIVVERIIREHNLGGHQLVTFGDGPVELRETRRRGGICVGVASDEVRRFGLNGAKRTRLIRAGAGLVIADYSQLDVLLRVLQLT